MYIMDIYKSSSKSIYLTKPYSAISVYFYMNVVVDLWVIECNQAENITPRVMKRQQERE